MLGPAVIVDASTDRVLEAWADAPADAWTLVTAWADRLGVDCALVSDGVGWIAEPGRCGLRPAYFSPLTGWHISEDAR